MKPWLRYTLLRVLLFAVPLALLLLLQVEWWMATLLAAVIGFCLSYILLRGQRDQMALAIATRRGGPVRGDDESAEDELDAR